MEKIVKIAPNNVEVQTFFFDENNQEVIINKESFGLEKALSVKKGILGQIEALNNQDLIAAQIAKLNKQLNVVQEVLTKISEDIVN